MLSFIDFEKRLFRGFGSNQFLVSFCNLLKERNPDNDYKLQKECYPYGRRSLDNLLHHIIYTYVLQQLNVRFLEPTSN